MPARVGGDRVKLRPMAESQPRRSVTSDDVCVTSEITFSYGIRVRARHSERGDDSLSDLALWA